MLDLGLPVLSSDYLNNVNVVSVVNNGMGIASALERQRAGILQPGRLRLEASSSPWLLQRVIRVNTLEGHEGCVNTVEFSPDGNTLLSGSDDFKIILWDWQRGEQRLAFFSSHHGNIFQAKPLPGSDNRIIFSCAADGHVLVHTQESSGNFFSRELGSHDARVHKLALSPDSAFLLSAGEDGYVRWYDVRAPTSASSQATVVGIATTQAADQRVPIFGISINPCFPLQAVIAADKPDLDVIDLRMPARPDRPGARVLRRLLPPHREVMDGPGVSSAIYSRQGDILASYMSDSIFLFPGTELAGAGHERSLQRATELYAPVESPLEHRPQRRPSPDNRESQRGGTRTPPVGSDNEALVDDDVRAFLAEHLTELLGSQPNSDGSAEMRVRLQADSNSDDDEGSGLSIPEDIETSSSSHSNGEMDDDDDDEVEDRSNDLIFREPLFAWEDDVDSDEDPNTPDNQEMERSPSPPDNDDGDWGEYASSGLATSSSSSDGGSSDRSSGSSDGYRSGNSNTERMELPNDHPMWDVGLPGTVSLARPWYEEEPDEEILQRYRGHRNTETIKSVSFLGPEDNWIVSGSDDGYMYIWDRYTGQLLVHQRADRYIMNCIAQHPSMPYVMATSGIENDIKLWEIGREDPMVPGLAARRCMDHNIASSRADRMGLEEMASMVEQGATLRLNMPACPTQ